MSILPTLIQTKVHFKILQLFDFTFDMSFLRRALHRGLDGNGVLALF